MTARTMTLAAAIAAMLMATSCGGRGGDTQAVPRPQAYARMALPDSVYTPVDGVPLHLEGNAAARVDTRDDATKIDIAYPGLGAVIYLTLTPVTDETAPEVIANRSERMARNAGDNTTEVLDLTTAAGDARITVTPTGSPTPVQFIARRGDIVVSGQAFVDAAATVRTDSLQPLVDMLRRDVIHMVRTLH